MSNSVFRRVSKIVLHYWPFLLGSVFAAIIYVVFNSLSIWLTASLLNNILADFQELVNEHEQLKTTVNLTLNQQFKFWTNSLVLRSTAFETLKILCVVIFVIFLLKNIFLYLKNILTTHIQFKFITELRNQLYHKLLSLPLSFYNNQKSGELTSIIINDVENMRHAFTVSFQRLFVEPINILAFIVMLFVISIKMSLIALIIIPVSGVLIIAMGRSLKRKSRRTATKIADITNIITERLNSIRIVKAFVAEKYEESLFNKATNKYFRLLNKRARLKLISSPVTEVFGVCIAILLIIIGGREVLQSDTLTSEDFLRFILILFSVLSPIRLLSNVNLDLQMGMASAERVFKLIDTKSEIIESPYAQSKHYFDRNIELKNVSFQYNDSDIVLKNVSFKISKGEMVALVGESGAGKSTIADLIPRFFDVNNGSITIDDIDIREIKISDLRQLMGIVTQETILFNNTIEANIAYSKPTSTSAEIKSAAKSANALEFINDQPKGFQTSIGEKGVKLSGGQRQRLAIARAILKNPPILILDEATSSLDSKSEKVVQTAIEKLMHNRTVLVIAHRLSTIQNANKIIFLENGEINQIGTHQQLMQSCKSYRILYETSALLN